MRVMIVEDEAVVAIDLECRLQALGYDVVGIADGLSEALSLFESALPDLVLLDVRLRHGDDGVALARAIRVRADRPIVFITAYNDAATLRRATGIGPHGYLIKPFDDRMLVVTLAIALERHAAERTLRIYRSALQSASFGVLLLAQRDGAPRIAYANEEYLRMSGRTLEEVRDEPPCILAVDPDDEGTRALLEAIRTGARTRREVRCRRADGLEFWVSAAVSPVEADPAEDPVVLVFLIDVTREREAREALHASQRMEVAGRLAAAVAHDFNNVMTAIGSFAELALEAPSLDQCRDDLREVLRATWTGARLMQKLLQVARPPRAQQGVASDLAQVLASARPTLERLVGPQISLQLRLGADSLVVGLGVNSLEQVIFNLASNARDAMPRGGALRIEVARSAALSPAQAVMRFADTGVGMSPELMARIFDPFFTTKPTGLGTGIGLSTTRALVEAAGGAITVRSEVEVGTDFEVRLPLVAAAPEFVDETETLGSMLHRARGEVCALLLPPGPVRQAYARGLALVGFDVREFSSIEVFVAGAAEAIDAVRVAVLDVSDLAEEAPQARALARLRESLPEVPLLVVGGLSVALPPEHVRPMRRPCSTALLARAALDELALSPGRPGASTPTRAIPPRPAPLRSPTVLIVDDDLPLARGLERALRHEGYRARGVSTFEEAEALLAQGPFDLLVTDVQLRDRNGLDLLQSAPTDLSSTPVLVISGDLSQRDARRAIEGRVSGFLPKPFDLDQFKAAVRAALDEGAAARLQRSAQRARGATEPREALLALRERFESSLRSARPRLTPVISLEGDAPFGWEVGLDADGPLADLASLLQAAEALGEVERLGALMRSATVRAADEVSAAALLFLRVHPWQLLTPLLTRDRAFVERASRIVLEVAEPGVLRSVAQLAENLAELRLLGFRVALHNPGVEAGSIEWMRSLQPEFAVLGAAVVRALPEDEAQRAMAELLLRVGRRARTRFIADGVERAEEREALRALGCDLMRGRLFARPDAPTGGAAP